MNARPSFRAWTVAILAIATFTLTATATPPRDLLVSGRFSNNVLRYAGSNGSFVGQFNMGGGLSNPAGLAFDPNANLYVANFNTNQILLFGPDGTFVGVFSSNADAPGFGFPLAITFGPDHNLYSTSNVTAGVYAFSSVNGAFIRVAASGNGLSGATGLVFLPNGDLLVSSAGTNQILRFSGTSNSFLGTFGTGVVLSNPTDLQMGPDGMVYAASTLNNRIVRYDPTSGAGQNFITTGLAHPIGLAFDDAGNLYVANQQVNNILKFASDGTSLGIWVPAGSGGLNGPDYFAFVPPPICHHCIGDVNGDGLQNSADIQAFLSCMTINPTATGCPCADANNDGVVDLSDVDPFVSLLLNGGQPCP